MCLGCSVVQQRSFGIPEMWAADFSWSQSSQQVSPPSLHTDSCPPPSPVSPELWLGEDVEGCAGSLSSTPVGISLCVKLDCIPDLPHYV